MNKEHFLLALSALSTLNTQRCLPLIEKCGGIEGLFMESEKNFKTLLTEYHIKYISRQKALEKARKEEENIHRHRIEICSVEETAYPPLLKECPDTPLVFFYKGSLTPSPTIYLAIVGTRRASDICRKRIDTIVKGLAHMSENIAIVSGLAFGIDGAAHQAALKYGLKTYAVLGHGLHMIYPAEHKHMAEKILTSGGAILSEFSCESTVIPANFLKRNRIIAGISHATLIAESPEKGGSMATARIAQSYHRDILAFPGRPEDKMSAGCNLLIKENTAALIENSDDILKALNILPEKQIPCQLPLIFNNENTYDFRILNIISQKGGVHIDELSQLLSIPVQELSVRMLQLEFEEKIISLPGNHYILK